MEEHTFPSSQEGVPYVARPDGVYFADNLVAGRSMATEILRLAERDARLTELVNSWKPLAERERKLREALARLVATSSADDWDAWSEARETARDLVKVEE